VTLTTLHHLAPTLKKDLGYACSPTVNHRGLFQGEIYLLPLLYKEDKIGMELNGLYLVRVCANVCWLKENVNFVEHKIQML
jgi:hypothetical protein